MLTIDLNKDPGRGNLSARAYVAALVGPRRIAHGRRVVKVLSSDKAMPLTSAVSGDEVMYFEIWIPPSKLAELPGNGAFIAFSSSENVGGQDAFQILLSATQRYAGVLTPDDQLYGQAIRDAAFGSLAGQATPIVVSSVVF